MVLTQVLLAQDKVIVDVTQGLHVTEMFFCNHTTLVRNSKKKMTLQTSNIIHQNDPQNVMNGSILRKIGMRTT